MVTLCTTMRGIEDVLIGTPAQEHILTTKEAGPGLTDCTLVDAGVNDIRNVSVREDKPAELLLVDDDSDAAGVLAEALELEGYRVRVAGDGQKGLTRLDEGLPDIVVLDVEMPLLDGPTMALQMFLTDAGKEKIPILLCSGILNLPSVAAQVGTPYFLAKPYTLDAMFHLVARALTERKAATPHVPRRSD